MHIPRTGGSSFRHFLMQALGDHLTVDPGTPYFVPSWIRHTTIMSQQRYQQLLGAPASRGECIHGHFMPYKYNHLRHEEGVEFITWMREPVERVVSHYQFCIDAMDQDGRSPFQRQVYKEQWSLEAFVEHPYNRNVYQQYLWRFPIHQFATVGISEHFVEDLHFIARKHFHYGKPTAVHDNKSSSIYISDTDRSAIADLNQSDVHLYNQALDMRQSRLTKVS